ncbi:MAG: STAS domain-containing protein [Fibrobacterota bacterium]
MAVHSGEYVFRPDDGRALDFPKLLLQAGMDHMAKGPEAGHMVVDLANCTVLNSRGIGAIVNLTNRFSRERRPFILRNVRPQVMQMFDLMNLTPFLIIEEGSVDSGAAGGRHSSIFASLKVDYEVMGDIGVFKFIGAIDSSADSAMFLNIINKIINDGCRMLLDLREVRHIDSLGVGVLVRLVKLMADGKAEVRFFGASPVLKEILQLNNLTSMVPVYETREAALHGWNGGV